MLIVVNPDNRTIQDVKDIMDVLTKAFKERSTEDIGFLCDIKQDLIDDEDYEMLINFRELEDEYFFGVPFMVEA